MEIEIGWKPKEAQKGWWRYRSLERIKASTVHFWCLCLWFFYVKIDFEMTDNKREDDVDRGNSCQTDEFPKTS